jgi:hypothetical protein
MNYDEEDGPDNVYIVLYAIALRTRRDPRRPFKTAENYIVGIIFVPALIERHAGSGGSALVMAELCQFWLMFGYRLRSRLPQAEKTLMGGYVQCRT